MKQELILCDMCSAPEAKPVFAFADRRVDGAGSMENWYYKIDLCHDCCTSFFNAAMEKLADRATWLKAATMNHGRME